VLKYRGLPEQLQGIAADGREKEDMENLLPQRVAKQQKKKTLFLHYDWIHSLQVPG